MRPVNLLPERHRPRTATGGRQGSSYIVLAALGGVLVAALIYVLTVNQINSRRDAVTQAKADTQQAQARIQSLSAYGNFVTVKNARVQAVKQLAEGRFDWELMMRELARVLPADVWLQSANASDGDGSDSSTSGTSSSSSSSSTSSSSTPSSSTTTGDASTATLDLTGCAKSQHEVAVTLVRLRQMAGATDVSLKQSTATQSDGATSGSSSSSGSCAPGQYSFEANVSLTKQDTGSDKVPASLGGGS